MSVRMQVSGVRTVIGAACVALLFAIGVAIGAPSGVRAAAAGGCSGDPDACWFSSQCSGICAGYYCNQPTCQGIGVGEKCYMCLD